MNVLFLPQAAQEFEEAVLYLEEQESGLGIRFRNEVDTTIHWISNNPTLPRLREGVYRRVNLSIFRYYIAYLVKSDTIWVLAIAHGHREPEYWINRSS